MNWLLFLPLLSLEYSLAVENVSEDFQTRDAKPNEFPYVVRVTKVPTICIGVLVTILRIVTAGHCFVKYDRVLDKIVKETDLKNYTVLAGAESLISVNMQKRVIVNFHTSPQLNLSLDYRFYHDIAIAEVGESFVLTEGLQLAKFWSLKKIDMRQRWLNTVYKTNKTCYAVAWSNLMYDCDENGTLTVRSGYRKLQVMQVKPLLYQMCRTLFTPNSNVTTEGEICTYSWNYKEGPCGGDNGSPLICDGYIWGLHLENIVCSKFEMKQHYLLYWPYIEKFKLPEGMTLSGSNRLSLSPSTKFISYIFCVIFLFYK